MAAEMPSGATPFQMMTMCARQRSLPALRLMDDER
jgi:hypothetical protein